MARRRVTRGRRLVRRKPTPSRALVRAGAAEPLVPRDLFGDLNALRRSLDHMFGDLGPRPWPAWTAEHWGPPVEMYETDDEVVVRAGLFDIDPKHVEITVTDGAITLKGAAKREEEEKGRTYHRRELRYSAFARTLSLPASVESAKARAAYKDGILEITIPKMEQAKATPVKIHIAA